MTLFQRDTVVAAGTTQSLQAHFCPLPATNWTRRAYHASIVVDDYVYIDGGEVALGQQPYPTNGSMPNPTYDPVGLNISLSLPLGESWDPDTVRFNVIVKPGMPLWNFQSLWHDETDNSLWAFGGEISLLASISPDLGIWNMKLNGGGGGTWMQRADFRGAPWNQSITRPLGGAAKSSKSTGFLLGGYSSARSSPFTSDLAGFVPTPGLLTYDFGNGTWANTTNTPCVSSSRAIEWSSMELAPFGPNGLMVIIGGETSDLTSYNPGAQERSMTQITLFDPVTFHFYQQTATGDKVPSPRMRFCIAGVRDSSNGSFEIYIYGGYAGSLGPGAEQYDEIWVLTLPAFEWIQVDASHKSARFGHTCHVVGNSQLLSIGGADPNQSDPWSTIDSAFQGLGVFDLNGWNWTTKYNANAATYKRAGALDDLYESNGAYPKTWDMPELRDLIMNNVTAPSTFSSTSTFPSITSLASATSSSNPSPGLSRYVTIGIGVGSGIGGIIFLLLLGALLYVYLRRRRIIHDVTYRNELSGHSNRHELPPAPRIQGRRPVTRKFLVELAAGEVAVEKGTGLKSPGRLSPAARSSESMRKAEYDSSPTSSGTWTSSPPLKPGYPVFTEPLPPPTPPKLVVSPPNFRYRDHGG